MKIKRKVIFTKKITRMIRSKVFSARKINRLFKKFFVFSQILTLLLAIDGGNCLRIENMFFKVNAEVSVELADARLN